MATKSAAFLAGCVEVKRCCGEKVAHISIETVEKGAVTLHHCDHCSSRHCTTSSPLPATHPTADSNEADSDELALDAAVCMSTPCDCVS